VNEDAETTAKLNNEKLPAARRAEVRNPGFYARGVQNHQSPSNDPPKENIKIKKKNNLKGKIKNKKEK
jgi:hypothetical protein